MTQQQLTQLNLGQSLDDLANLDPRGYGVCKILYAGARQFCKEPLCMNAAKKLHQTLAENDIVYIMTGFVLRPFKHGETDGIISSLLLARALVMAYNVKPIVVIPEDNLEAAVALTNVCGLHAFENLDEFINVPVSVGVKVISKDVEIAKMQAEELFGSFTPKAAVIIECPGANEKGEYHNAIGLNVTQLEAKQDALFDLIKKNGILNIAIGDLGNEIGMGAIKSHICKFVPYAAKGSCQCSCGGGIVAESAADNIITATVSDWGGYALIACIAYLCRNIDIMHTPHMEEQMCKTACANGMIDMYGWLIPSIDGFGLEINMPIVQLMRSMVEQSLRLETKCKTWFEKVDELNFFEGN